MSSSDSQTLNAGSARLGDGKEVRYMVVTMDLDALATVSEECVIDCLMDTAD